MHNSHTTMYTNIYNGSALWAYVYSQKAKHRAINFFISSMQLLQENLQNTLNNMIQKSQFLNTTLGDSGERIYTSGDSDGGNTHF